MLHVVFLQNCHTCIFSYNNNHKQVHRILKVTLVSYFKPELMLKCTMFMLDTVHSAEVQSQLCDQPQRACPSRVTVHGLCVCPSNNYSQHSASALLCIMRHVILIITAK